MSLTPVMSGEIISTDLDKIINIAKLTRMGLRASTTEALAKIPLLCGCRMAVETPSIMSGADVSSTAEVIDGIAKTVDGDTLTGWVPVKLNVGSVSSLKTVTCSLINTIKYLAEEIPLDSNTIPYGYRRLWCKFINYYPNPYWFFVSEIKETPWWTSSTFYGLDGHTYRAYYHANDWSTLVTWYRDEVVVGGGNATGLSNDYSLGFRIKNEGTPEQTITPYSMYGDPPEYSQQLGPEVSYPHIQLYITGADYISSNTSLAPTVPQGGSPFITINIPSLEFIKQANPGYTNAQALNAAIAIIRNNPEYVTAYNEFGLAKFNWMYAGYYNKILVPGDEKKKGYGFYVGAEEWNKLTEAIALVYSQHDWSLDAYPLDIVAKDDIITAEIFNQAKNAIGSKRATGILDKIKGNPCIADDFNALRTALNSIP